MNYFISYFKPTQQYLPVEAHFNCELDDELFLQFPAWRPGRYELGNFAKNIKNFAIVDESNKKMAFEKTGKDRWKVHCKDAKSIKVSYYYYAAELNAGSTYMDDVQLYVNPVNCLVFIEERQNQPCTLKLELPDNFELATGAKHEKNTLFCGSFHELADSPFIASATLQHKAYSVLDCTFHIWFQGLALLNWERIIVDFEKFTQAQLEKFSNRRDKIIGFPVKEYHFLYQILPQKAYHGVEHLTSTVITLGPGSHLMTDVYDDFLGVSSHELYHVWNIKSIRPSEMYPYNYATENFSKLGYVAEGVTTYLGDVFLAESHVKPFSWYQLELEKLLQKHFDNFGRFNYSVAASSWDTWLDGYVKGVPMRKVSIYNEGALLAFITDMMIRKGSNNKASIHDVMNHLYVHFAQKNCGYTEADYQTACERFGEMNFGSFFANFVHGTHPFESILVEALETIGFTLEMEKNPIHAERVLGIKTAELNEKTIVTDIFPGSSAELGALMIGDEIMALNKMNITTNLNGILSHFLENPLQLVVNRKGRLVEINCPNTNRAMYPIYKIKKMNMPSNLSKRIFKSWIGYQWDECN